MVGSVMSAPGSGDGDESAANGDLLHTAFLLPRKSEGGDELERVYREFVSIPKDSFTDLYAVDDLSA